MTFDEVLAQVRELLEREGRVSYRALKRRFGLDDDYLEDLKDELIKAKRWAKDEEGEVLVWTGDQEGMPTGAGDAKRLVPSPPPRTPEAERRQLTVMFCDLVGSTPLAEQLDPEDLREVVRQYQEACEQVIHRFEGYIARYVGDALLVYFGYPHAHEDDAQRAIRTGLGIVEVMPQLNERLQQTVGAIHELPLQVRIGIHTGLVVVGELGGRDYRESMALGETPNIAARLQGRADPNTVLISALTQRLTQGFFECQDQGLQAVKGVSAPLQVYRVSGESDVHSRFEVAIRTGLTPLVGRDEELAILRRCWAKTQAGEGQIVLLSGEAGIGKSRLVQELKEQAAREGGTRIEFRCSPYYQNTAFYPVTEHLQRLLQFQRDDSSQTKLAKLERMLQGSSFPQHEAVPLFASLLLLPRPDGYPPLNLTPQRQRHKTQEALGMWLLEEARRKPMLAVWEDLHWVDPSTLEMLTLFFDQVPTTQLLVVLTFRPNFTLPWQPCSHITPLTLSRLGRHSVEAMMEKITGGKPFPREVLQQIVAKTDGVPLFVEELTKIVLESGLLTAADDHYELTGPLPPLAIPSTLQDSLMARLDRLAPVREIAQLGATLGREFSYELLHAVSSLDEQTLQQGLRQLVEAELIYQRGLPPRVTYFFKHALIQDAAYQSLLKSTRQQSHRQIAQVLKERFPETVETQPELLAHHYTEAGLGKQAIEYWQRAGQSAIQRSANTEAIAHLTKGVELLKALPDTLDHMQQELVLQLALGTPLMATKGYSSPEVGQAYARARELCQQIGDTPQLFPVLYGLSVFYIVGTDLQAARELGMQCLSLAQRVQDSGLLLEAYTALGPTSFYLGKLAEARTQMEEALALYDPQHHDAYAFVYGTNPAVVALGFAARTLCLLGYLDQARQKGNELLAMTHRLSAHHNSLGADLMHLTVLHLLLQDGHTAREQAEALIALATEHELLLWLGMATMLRGAALVEEACLLRRQEEIERGIAQLRQGIASYRSTGAGLDVSPCLVLLAKGYGEIGQPQEGLSILAEALARVNNGGERYYEAELYRLKGELLLAQEGYRLQAVGYREKIEDAEEYFWKATEIARKQSAKSLELRAVMSLSRLWQQQGKKDEARQMLADIYGWFTEGFDTTDLQEAKGLLEELG